MRAGLLNTPIVILGATPIVDDLGSEAYSFTPKFTTKAQVIYNAKDKEYVNDLIIGYLTAELKLRAYNKISDNDRIQIKGKTFEIVNMFDQDNIKHIEVIETHV